MPRRRTHGGHDEHTGACRDDGLQICPAGDHALLVRLSPDQISPYVNAQVLALLAALDAATPPGVTDCVPGYASLLVTFDPLITDRSYVRDALHEAWQTGRRRARRLPARKVVYVPVRYGGAAGIDLDEVARLTSLSPEEVIRHHASGEYWVYFLGFLAGYPYLGGLPGSLAVPRLDVPRTHVPAGSVAIAEGQTGIYPVSSPGGWRVIGRTDLPIFDAHADPPAVFAPGDRVRFVPVEADVDTPEDGDTVATVSPRPAPPAPDAIPWLRVERAGPLTTVQDLGRPGYARYGVPPGGAADPAALRLGNLLVGNRADDAGLEITLGGAQFAVLAPCHIALTGARCAAATLDGHRLLSDTAVWAEAGSELELTHTTAGLRLYLCVSGGVAVPEVLGSRSTDLRGQFGGLDGRRLQGGDIVWRARTDELPSAVAQGPFVPAVRRSVSFPEAGGRWTLRVMPGPDSGVMPRGCADLLERDLIVESRSDRMGIRLRPEDGAMLRDGGQVLSAGVPRGAIQLPPGGEPVILGADGQTTGGYRIPLVVASADWWQVGQVRPSDRVRLRLISEDEAVAAALQQTRHGLPPGDMGAGLAPDLAVLMRGFAEWYDA